MKTYGDSIQPTYLLYEPLLRDGIRLLRTHRGLPLLFNTNPPLCIFDWGGLSDYIGARDANCGYPGILSFVRPFLEITKLGTIHYTGLNYLLKC